MLTVHHQAFDKGYQAGFEGETYRWLDYQHTGNQQQYVATRATVQQLVFRIVSGGYPIGRVQHALGVWAGMLDATEQHQQG